MASPEGGPSDEQLTRLVLRVLAGLVALTLAGGVASAAGRLADEEVGDRDETAADVIVGGLSPRGGLGPLPGTEVATYLRARGNALAAEPTPGALRAAVVSFRTYLTPAAARAALGATAAERFLVAVPGGRPGVVAADADLKTFVTGQRKEAVAEKAALEQLLPTVTDDDFRRQYQADIDRLAALLAAPADTTAAVVFAAVVEATVGELMTVATDDDVRLVDAVPLPFPTDPAGLRPEEISRAGAPPTRPS